MARCSEQKEPYGSEPSFFTSKRQPCACWMSAIVSLPGGVVARTQAPGACLAAKAAGRAIRGRHNSGQTIENS